MEKTKTSKRITVDLTAAADRRLESLKDKMGATSKAQVIRYSLRILDWAVENHLEGYDFYAEKNGEKRSIALVVDD